MVVVTESGDARRAEHHLAMDLLGVRPSAASTSEDGSTQQRMSELVARLDEVMSEVQPDEVYLPFPSLHQDHIAVYEAGMRSARLSMAPDHWVPDAVLVYDIAVYDVNLYPTDLRWNVFEALTEEQADKKAAACAAYASENPGGPHPMNSMKEIAATVGHMRKVDVRRAVRPRAPGPPVKVTIHQPDLLPYRGFWFKMATSDAFIVSVHDQFQKHGYQRRVTMRDAWCSHQLVGKPVADADQRDRGGAGVAAADRRRDPGQVRRREALLHARRRARRADPVPPRARRLDEVNIAMIEVVRDMLGITTPLVVTEPPVEGRHGAADRAGHDGGRHGVPRGAGRRGLHGRRRRRTGSRRPGSGWSGRTTSTSPATRSSPC